MVIHVTQMDKFKGKSETGKKLFLNSDDTNVKKKSKKKPKKQNETKPDNNPNLNNIDAKSKNIKKKKKSKKFKDKKTIVPIFKKPKSSDDVSSNWKQLLKSLPKDTPAIKSDQSLKNQNAYIKRRTEAKRKESKEVKIAPKPEVWFDDVDETLLDPEDRLDVDNTVDSTGNTPSLVKEKSFTGLTKVIGMDCEMVGVGHGGVDSILARVSLVNHFGHTVYDKFVAPGEKVTDYRTAVSGVRPQDLKGAEDFKTVQKEVSDLLKGRVLVGHSLKHDTKVLFLDHPRRDIRDTSLYKPFRAAFGGRTPSLKNLSARMLGVAVQTGEHSSVQDAQAAMRLYTMFRKEWEASIEAKRGKKMSKLKKLSKSTSSDKSSQENIQTGTVSRVGGDIQSGTISRVGGDMLQKRLQAAPRYSDSDSD